MADNKDVLTQIKVQCLKCRYFLQQYRLLRYTHTLPRVFPIASSGPAGQEVIEQVAVGQPNLCEGQDTAFSVVFLEWDVSLELVHLARRLS